MSGCFTHLVQDLDEDLHAADEDGGEGLDLLKVLAQALPLARVQKVLLTTLNVMGHLNISDVDISPHNFWHEMKLADRKHLRLATQSSSNSLWPIK